MANSRPGDHEEIRRKSEEIMHSRLAGIEAELREMREVLVKLARVEERMASVAAADARIDTQLTNVFTRLNALEGVTLQNHKTLGGVERAWWIVFAGVCSIVVGILTKRLW